MSTDTLHCLQVTDDQRINAAADGRSDGRNTIQAHMSVMHTLSVTHG